MQQGLSHSGYIKTPSGHLGLSHAVAGEEQRGLVTVQGEARAHFVEVAFQPAEGAVADGNDAVLVAFALADLERLALAVEVVQFELCEFAAAESGAVKDFEHGAVADAERVGDVGHGDDGFDLVQAERFLGQAFFRAWHFEFGGGVGKDGVLFAEPRKVVLHGAEPAALGGHAERLAVLLAPAPEVPLVAFEDRLGDLQGLP